MAGTSPTRTGMKVYNKYLYVLDLVPGIPGINTDVGPIAGDNGKLSIIVSRGQASNVFTFIATPVNMEKL